MSFTNQTKARELSVTNQLKARDLSITNQTKARELSVTNQTKAREMSNKWTDRLETALHHQLGVFLCFLEE